MTTDWARQVNTPLARAGALVKLARSSVPPNRRHLSAASKSSTTSTMAHLVLALFLIIFGLNLLIDLSLPIWITGLLALLAGVLLIMERFKIRGSRK